MITYPDNFFFRQYLFLINRIEADPDKDEYQERHHVFPIALFGPNSRVVRMSYKHHVILHYLLWRGYQTEFGNTDDRSISAARACFCMLSFNTEKRSLHEAYRQIAKDATIGMKLLFSDEHRKKLSDALTGKPHSAKWIEARVGHEVTELTRQRISEATKGRKSPMEGKIHSEETRRKISLSKVGKKASAETRSLLSSQRKGRAVSEATRQKTAATMKAIWALRRQQKNQEEDTN